MSKLRVSFDFDDTLSKLEVQEYCKELLNRGVEVFIVTMRYNQLLKHLWPDKPHNDDLFSVVVSLGIPRENIVFTNMKYKSSYLKKSGLIWHLDDLEEVIKEINNSYCGVPCIDVTKEDWKDKCNDLIEKYEIRN